MSKLKQRNGIPHIVTTFGNTTTFSGTLRFKESLRIKGNFEGEIDSKGFLYIDTDATVRVSKIRASSVIVGGVVHGDIEALDKVEMLPTAKVYGNVRTSKLRISDGVIFEGRCEMIRNPAEFNPFAVKSGQR